MWNIPGDAIYIPAEYINMKIQLSNVPIYISNGIKHITLTTLLGNMSVAPKSSNDNV